MKVYAITIISVCLVMAMTSGEYVIKTKEDFFQYRNECVAELQIPEDKVKLYEKLEYPDDPLTHCYLKCICSKYGLFDEQQGFNIEYIYQQILGKNEPADPNNELYKEIESCVDKNEQGSNACQWAYRCAICYFNKNLLLVRESVASSPA